MHGSEGKARIEVRHNSMSENAVSSIRPYKRNFQQNQSEVTSKSSGLPAIPMSMHLLNSVLLMVHKQAHLTGAQETLVQYLSYATEAHSSLFPLSSATNYFREGKERKEPVQTRDITSWAGSECREPSRTLPLCWSLRILLLERCSKIMNSTFWCKYWMND